MDTSSYTWQLQLMGIIRFGDIFVEDLDLVASSRFVQFDDNCCRVLRCFLVKNSKSVEHGSNCGVMLSNMSFG